MTRIIIKPRLLAGISQATIAILAWPALAQAQTADAEPEQGGDIIVTGSRIARPQIDFPNPITAITATQIQESGRTNITDLLTQTPALVGSQTSNTNAGSNAAIGTSGLNLLNLRNLGPQRTLVLVDGRRHVASLPGTAAVDINTIPVDLIERVDVLTGGASAIYGADGVTGVVNFVTKKDFEGILARGQMGISERGDAGNRFFSITAGKNFADGRGNFTLNYEYDRDERLQAYQRKRNLTQNRTTFQNNPDDPDDDPNIPDNVPLKDVRFYDSSRAGGIDVDFDGVPDYRWDGSPWDGGRFVPPFYQQGGDGTPRSDYIGDLLPDIERHNVNALFRYEVTDGIDFFVQGKYVKTKTFTISQPTFDFYSLIQPDNPYLPANLRQIALDNANNPDIEMAGVLLNRDNFDLGTRGEDVDRETIRSVVGFEGDISSHARFEISYVYGQTKVKNRQIGNRYNDRFYAAVDAVDEGQFLTGTPNGNIVCRSNLDPTALPFQPLASPGINNFGSFTPGPNSGCVPLNPFGEGSPSQQAIDWVTLTSIARDKLTQHVVSGSVSGDLGGLFSLPGGDVGYAIGAEYRREGSKSTPDPADTAGFTFNNVLLPSKGHYDVWEIFGEINVPLLKDRPFAEELSFGGAVRYSDYSTVGSTWTWKVDGVYAPIRDVRFRATYAEAVRAPNISELFDPANQTFLFIDDPCDVNNVNNGASTRRANCAALLTAAGADPNTFRDPNSASIPGVQTGNPDLTEETAKTTTAGIVLQPRFLPGLTASVDWYNIKLKSAITTVTAQRLADLCVDQATIDNQFCANITRQVGGANAGGITGFTLLPQNVANFHTRGVDFTVNYQFAVGEADRIALNLVGGYLDKLTFIGSPGADPSNDRNVAQSVNGGPAPKWLLNFDATWKHGPLTVNYGFNYFGKTLRFLRSTTTGDDDYVEKKYFHLKSKQEHEIQLSYDINERFNVYFGVNNLFDQKPDFAEDFLPISGVGRYFYAGAKVKLTDIF
ncbi:TonB-dependent receptor [Sphingomonas sp. MM-1]|uniref:TonB-dependent receptor plug domain-containing protein n=1 Tax=Sphingomonas sp. MM-1 TaxID=745310 RepID=UPI0002C12441|nr:TonB-dependent receptor [Sphingomonas sp. MM-1]AGH51339.1 TonB-dependent receptor [Sphingomonas sp. MM-1]